jgi:uncharacterized glyoxalase superfamily protein PhnB
MIFRRSGRGCRTLAARLALSAAIADIHTRWERKMSKMSLKSRCIAPGLTVNDLQSSLRFYTQGLGFSVKEKNEVDGQVRFAMLKAGDGELGLGQDDFAKGRNRVKGIGMRLWISTAQDLRVLADQAKAAGITLDSDVAALPWGPLAFTVTDPDGFKLTIANDP